MSACVVLLTVFLAAVATLAAYMRRIYAEYGKILPREEQDNLDTWEELVEPRLGLSREHAALCASLVEQLALGMIALLFGTELFEHGGKPSAVDLAQAAVAVALVALFCNHLLPAFIFNRTEGRWAARMLWPIRALLWVVTPVTVPLRFFFSVVLSNEMPASAEEESAADVEALLDAGEEEGILEQGDKELVRSAVEFGDKLVREVMTPRPEVFAVEAETTLEQFLEQIKEHNYSRVPVYEGSLDNITGLAFAHDLLQIADEEAHTRTVASIERPAEFVPETKRGYELLREMQREQQHMRVVIDEYGSVAGLVTIEDLLEEIVGEIRDEHDEDEFLEEPVREDAGTWLAPGGFPADRLDDLFGAPVDLGAEYEATTLGGLVSELVGRIPLAGEVVLLESAGLRIEVTQSTDRKVEQVRIYPRREARGEGK
jgi:putative hemolysin